MASEGYRIPPVGERFRLVREVERFPHFIVDKGLTGTVVSVDHGVIYGKMDQHIPDCEEWDNCIQWDGHPDSDPRYDQDVEVINDSVWCTGCGRSRSPSTSTNAPAKRAGAEVSHDRQ